MPNPTPAAQVAALAELVGITPKTHRHLYRRSKPGEFVAADLLESLYGADHDTKPYTLIAPDPLGPDADGVWAVPFMYWLRDNAREPTVCEYPRGWKAYVMNDESEHIRGYAATMTAALLQACLAARVPEVCKILEATHE